MRIIVVIPARYASTRYPGKPLVQLRGATGLSRTLIQRSWEAAQSIAGVDQVVVATDDERIASEAGSFGAEVVMTSTACRNGTERCAEAIDKLEPAYDLVLNLQGDAPLIPPWFMEDMISAMKVQTEADVATPVLRCDGQTLHKLQADRRAGRVGATTAVFARDHRALYFSKEVIPFLGSDYEEDEPTPVFHHVGAYAYRPTALKAYLEQPAGMLERQEGLEQLRFLECGIPVHCVEVDARDRQFWELNNPGDVAVLETMMAEMGIE